MISQGAKIARYNRTKKSALDIVNRIINENTPIKMQAQVQLERPGATIGSTTAAVVVADNLRATAGRWDSEIESIQSVLEPLLKQAMSEATKEMKKKLYQTQARQQKEQANLTEFWKANNKALEDKVSQLEKKLDQNRKRCVIM